MSTIFNLKREQTKDLFFGDSLGLQDYINIQYPIIEELAQKQRSQFWIETEISLDQDHKQWPNLPKGVQEITLMNLAWQLQADSIVGRAPTRLLGPLISNPELENMVEQWQYFEAIHSRAYSNIIRSVLPNANEFINSVADDANSYARLDLVVRIFDELYNSTPAWLEYYESNPDKSSSEYKEKLEVMQLKLLDFYFAVYALEAIQFYSSFACTFALGEQDILSGIAGNLELIAKDEAVHTQMTCETLKILKNQVSPAVWECAMRNAPKVLIEILKAEINWGYTLFSNGRKIIGHNAELNEDYLYYIAKLAFEAIGLDYPSDLRVVTKHPIPWIEYWLNPGLKQVAPQETQIKTYKVGSVIGSSDSALDDMNSEFGDDF